MQKAHTLIFALYLIAGSCLAQEQQVLTRAILPEDILRPGWIPDQKQQIPTRPIIPEDIIQDSIQTVRFGTNSFAVRWTYTEVGARKMLAFDEAHVGETVRTEVGSLQFTGGIAPFTSLPGCASYSEWRTGWLKHRTDKFFGVSEEDAKKIVAGLKKQ